MRLRWSSQKKEIQVKQQQCKNQQVGIARGLVLREHCRQRGGSDDCCRAFKITSLV
jgi:hypothetical protein